MTVRQNQSYAITRNLTPVILKTVTLLLLADTHHNDDGYPQNLTIPQPDY